MLKICFNTLTLKNFKSHQDLKVEFGDTTQITGDNAEGKSSIIEAISWLLYGTNPFGSKMDPSPITYEYDETLVSLLLEIDKKQLLLGRALKKGKTSYYINEIPSKAGEFNKILEKLFDKDLFLSLFNPSYFPSLHWEKQRTMILQYITPPLKKDVLKNLPKEQQTLLSQLFEKYSLDDIEKINREEKRRLEKSYIAAQSRTKTLKEQLDQLGEQRTDIEALKAESEQLQKKILEIQDVIDSASSINTKINRLQARITSLLEERDSIKAQFKDLKNEPIEDYCRACKQPLVGEALESAQSEKESRINHIKTHFDEVVEERKKLEAELAKLEYIDVSEQLEKIRELEQKRQKLQDAIRNEKLYTDYRNAEADESATKNALNAAIFTLDCVKAFRAKEAELQAEKVQALFEILSIKLFDHLKNGELKPTFEIELDGKPYSKLSLSETIRAGLELREVLSKQSELVLPVFIDNAESITSFKNPSGQLITLKVVAGQKLKIEVKDK